MAQLDKGRDFSFCPNCGERLALPAQEALTELPQAQEEQVAVEQIVVQRRTAFETALVRVKALLRDRAEAEKRPTCFISYAWGVPEHERWVIQLARDMRNASIDILLDRWHNPPGGDIDRYTDKIESSEFVVVVGTPLLKEKYESNDHHQRWWLV
ncbi:MAG: toll/interleukin-1 receptor domain-containing protein [Bacteroidetes bacterium]|nr:toll/interleukin-1 receptor domain-containing protein [Bacteroidota bacterium]